MTNYEKLNNSVIQALKKAEEVHKTNPGSLEPHKALLFFLEKYNTGSYYGTIALKITGSEAHNPKELEVTHRLDHKYV